MIKTLYSKLIRLFAVVSGRQKIQLKGQQASRGIPHTSLVMLLIMGSTKFVSGFHFPAKLGDLPAGLKCQDSK